MMYKENVILLMTHIYLCIINLPSFEESILISVLLSVNAGNKQSGYALPNHCLVKHEWNSVCISQTELSSINFVKIVSEKSSLYIGPLVQNRSLLF